MFLILFYKSLSLFRLLLGLIGQLQEDILQRSRLFLHAKQGHPILCQLIKQRLADIAVRLLRNLCEHGSIFCFCRRKAFYAVQI